jgi:hypothetical protein
MIVHKASLIYSESSRRPRVHSLRETLNPIFHIVCSAS